MEHKQDVTCKQQYIEVEKLIPLALPLCDWYDLLSKVEFMKPLKSSNHSLGIKIIAFYREKSNGQKSRLDRSPD